jgi:hypothetical protein
MNSQSAIQDATTVAGGGPNLASNTQKTLDDIKALLHDIRDLQRAHFERYEEFTGRIIAAERARQEGAYQRQVISWVVWGGLVLLLLGSMFFSQFFRFFF